MAVAAADGEAAPSLGDEERFARRIRPAPHRELGLMLYREGDLRGACRELGHYLELAPEAEDAPRMRDYLLELEQAGDCR